MRSDEALLKPAGGAEQPETVEKWYRLPGPENDVVLSARVTLARSLPDFPYPQRMNAAGRLQVERRVCEAMEESAAITHRFSYLRMEELEKDDCYSLAERGLVSASFARERMGGLLYTQDESLSVAVNDEDHLRICARSAGSSLGAVYAEADRLDTLMGKNMPFAFDPDLGYLTQDPARLGTGMYASLRLHLYALSRSGSIGRIASGLAKLGLSLEGEQENWNEEEPSFYRLSNRVTLGLSEEEAIHNLQEMASQLIAQERAARVELARKLEVQDEISRASGVLQSARMISSAELCGMLSRVRFGVSAGLIDNAPYELLDALTIELQPATLSKAVGRLSRVQRDGLRAEIVRERLFGGAG